MKLLARILIGFIFTAVAMAQSEPNTLVLSWDIPTERVNGDPLPLEEIDRYVLRCYLVDNPQERFTMDIPSVSNGGIFEGLFSDVFPVYGIFECELAVVDTWGLFSDFVVAEGPLVEHFPPEPNSPTNVLRLRAS